MKRIVVFLITVLVIYVIYYDLSSGTLPAIENQIEVDKVKKAEDEVASSEQIDYFEQQVSRGDTLLSIVEKKLDDSLPVSIEEVVEDFQSLNNGLEPEEIQYGKTYKFPYYLPLSEQ